MIILAWIVEVGTGAAKRATAWTLTTNGADTLSADLLAHAAYYVVIKCPDDHPKRCAEVREHVMAEYLRATPSRT